jgi:ABC-2 type transport system permease protein
MQTFRQYFKKEALEALRTNKYIILFVGTIFWALMDPLLLKLLPILLRSSLPIDMTSLLPELNRDTAFVNFAGDLFEIGTLFFGFTLMGLLANEIRFKKLVFPMVSGARPAGVVLAKYIHYAIVLVIFILIAFLTNYFYTVQLFEGGILSISIVLRAAVLYALYYCVLLAILLFLSSLFKRGLFAGIIIIVFAYTMSIFNQFQGIRQYMPNYLLLKAQDILGGFDTSLIPTLLISVVLIIIFIALTISRMRRINIA